MMKIKKIAGYIILTQIVCIFYYFTAPKIIIEGGFIYRLIMSEIATLATLFVVWLIDIAIDWIDN